MGVNGACRTRAAIVQRNEAEPSREDVGWADWFEETFGSPGEAGLPEAVDASSNPLPETVVERKTAEDSTTAREHVDLKEETQCEQRRNRDQEYTRETSTRKL